MVCDLCGKLAVFWVTIAPLYERLQQPLGGQLCGSCAAGATWWDERNLKAVAKAYPAPKSVTGVPA